jgi:hypothetical protein
MVRPSHFGFNAETALNNAFQQQSSDDPCDIQRRAVEEFDAFVQKLRDLNVKVVQVQDPLDSVIRPDALFPNNVMAFMHGGIVVTFPMFAKSRRLERREEIIQQVLKETDMKISKRLRLEEEEANEKFLEGTGSIVFDHRNRFAYACKSARTNESVLDQFCKELGYQKVIFTAVDQNGLEIYHTNVMMSIGRKFVVICLESIRNLEEKKMLLDYITTSGREIIDISLEQMANFAGNMLEIQNSRNESILVMSETAQKCLEKKQMERLQQFVDYILCVQIPTIEHYGGGSARCMMAEIFS